MKCNLKFLSLIAVGFFFTACADNDLDIYGTAEQGENIVFGARAYFENGDSKKNTRTEYGDVNDTRDKIALNWVVGDQLDIASEKSPSAKKATYKVVNADKGYGTGNADGKSAAVLQNAVPGVGIQWGQGQNDFYAIYPSSAKFSGSKTSFNLDAAQKKVTGFMPMSFATPVTKVGSDYQVKTNMDYAFMVAENSVVLGENTENLVSLEFKPLVTAIQFDITANVIGRQNTTGDNKIRLTSLSLYSSKLNNIAGNFEYTFDGKNTGKLVNTSETGTGANRLTLGLEGQAVDLTEGHKCDVTFFMLPSDGVVFQMGDLKLDIFYEVNGTPQFCTAVINKDLKARYKYYFKNLLLPEVKENVEGSAWFSALEPTIYLSQVSFPCAGNAFSNMANSVYNREQVKTYEELWNMGVRGFEFVTQTGAKTSSTTLGDQHFVCGEEVLDGTNGTQTTPTFDEAFKNLTKFITDNETYPQYKNECLIILARYHAVNDGYSPQRYVNHLINYLSSCGIDKSRFVKITSESTVQDLNGKIAIIVRPGDDDYIKYVKGSTDLVASDWENNLLIIKNWGSAYDRWDMRYDGYMREATWGDVVNPGMKKIEDCLWSVSNRQNQFRYVRGEHQYAELPQESLKFAHATSDLNITAQVQEWARVSPANQAVSTGNGIYADFSIGGGGTAGGRQMYWWVKWPESISQKKRAIDALLKQSVASGVQDNKMFINVLSGYYITGKHMKGAWPYQEHFSIAGKTITPQGQGNGGNYADLAADLNLYLYKILKRNPSMSDGSALAQGPWGLIFVDYIGATEQDFIAYGANEYVTNYKDAATASTSLPRVIYMNNFTFPLAHKTTVEDPENSTGTLTLGSSDEIVVAD